jgi:hypothetical protein
LFLLVQIPHGVMFAEREVRRTSFQQQSWEVSPA